MPEYAYRGIDADGSPVRAAVSAEDPEKVVLRARERGHHVVMVYGLENEPEPHYERLLETPNFPPPPFLKTGSPVFWQSRRALRAAIRNGLVEGKAGWFRTQVRTESLLKLSTDALGRRVFEKGLLASAGHRGRPPVPSEREPCMVLTEYQKAESARTPVVEADEDFEPPECLRDLISSELAHARDVVPYSIEGGRLLLLAARPWDLATADALSAYLAKAVTLARCRKDPRQNHETVARIVGRVYPVESMEDWLERARPGHFWRETEVWEGTAKALPPLPVERERQVLGGRTEELLSDVSELALRDDAESCPIVKLLELLVFKAGSGGWSGVRLQTGKDESCLQLFHGEKACELDPPPRRLYEPIVLFLSAAVGIEPATLPPANSQVELEFEGKSFTVTGETRFTDRGQGIEVRWSVR